MLGFLIHVLFRFSHHVPSRLHHLELCEVAACSTSPLFQLSGWSSFASSFILPSVSSGLSAFTPSVDSFQSSKLKLACLISILEIYKLIRVSSMHSTISFCPAGFTHFQSGIE